MVDEISSKDFVNLKCLGGEFGYVLGCFENEVNVQELVLGLGVLGGGGVLGFGLEFFVCSEGWF